MLKRLSIAGSLALFVTLLSMLMAVSTISYLVYKERQAITNQVVDGSVSLAKIGAHEIQSALYYNDEISLTNIAD